MMPCPICKCETAQTVCPNCGGNTNHARLALSKGWPLETVQEALARSFKEHQMTATMLCKFKWERDGAVSLLRDINGGTDIDLLAPNGDHLDGILLTREFVERVNMFLKEVQ
jgi:hypothetical protein